MTALDLTPAPGAAPMPVMVLAQALAELRGMLRNGEQLLLTMIIPILLLVGFAKTSVLDMGAAARVDFVAPGVIGLAVMSTAFTGQAIATGFERRYRVLKRLGATPLTRGGLLAGKTLAVVMVELIQIAAICAVAVVLGWSPHASPASAGGAALLVLAGTAAFSGLGLLMAGVMRPEATLAAANLVYLLLLALGGVVFPADRLPAALAAAGELLPITALTGGLRTVLSGEGGFPAGPLMILLVWAAAALTLAARTFRWE